MKMLVVGAVTALTLATAAARTKIANDVLPYCKLAPEAAMATHEVTPTMNKPSWHLVAAEC